MSPVLTSLLLAHDYTKSESVLLSSIRSKWSTDSIHISISQNTCHEILGQVEFVRRTKYFDIFVL